MAVFVSFTRRCLLIAFLLMGGLAVGGLVAHAGDKPDILTLSVQKIELRAKAVPFRRGDESKKIFGKLIYRSGYVLSSASPYWGGLSGLVISKNGREAALVSDAGLWARLSLTYEKNRLLPPKAAEIGPLMALKNRPLKRHKDRDAEAIALIDDGSFFSQCYISFEGNHRIGRFLLGKDGISGPSAYLKVPAITGRLSGNAGLEAMTVIQRGRLKGTLVAIAQSRRDGDGNYIGWLYQRGKITKIRFMPPPLDLYRITDAASLPNGDVILLERRYKFFKVNIRVRYVRQAELISGKPIAGEILMEADSSQHLVDNMEGIAVHENSAGETIITLISDDNYNGFQNTLFLQFMLAKKKITAQHKAAPLNTAH